MSPGVSELAAEEAGERVIIDQTGEIVHVRKRRHYFYLAGPMSFRPQYNFPAFDAAANRLRERGYRIVSPAELDDPMVRAAALTAQDGTEPVGLSWRECLRRDLALVIDEACFGIIVLPGWESSDGARLETYVGDALGKLLLEYREHGDGTFSLHPINRRRALDDYGYALKQIEEAGR